MADLRFVRTLAAMLFSLSLICGCSGGSEDSPTVETEEPDAAEVADEIEMPDVE